MSRAAAYYDLGYFKTGSTRKSIPLRTIKNRLEAWNLDERYYDGLRENGYGGFTDDGRWDPLVKKLYHDFIIPKDGTILDLGCKKGFILSAFQREGHTGNLAGIENHQYPLHEASKIKGLSLECSPYYNLPFHTDSVDFLIAFSSIYMQSLGEVIKTLKEIQRVSQGRSHITLGAYDDEYSKKIFENWTLIGTTHLHTDDWLEVMKYCGYSGTYFFTTPKILGFI
jgi:hypothetical protein